MSFKGWTIAENFIAEQNVSHALYEFGYAAGISRPLALVARPERCNFCPENFQLGVEMYGGLGTNGDFGFRGTSQYIATTAAWTSEGGDCFLNPVSSDLQSPQIADDLSIMQTGGPIEIREFT